MVVLAVSLGGVESLIEHPASMTHCDRTFLPEIKEASGITDSLVRLRYNIDTVNTHFAKVLVSVIAVWGLNMSRTLYKTWSRHWRNADTILVLTCTPTMSVCPAITSVLARVRFIAH